MLQELSIENFRNYKKLSVNLNAPLVLILGNNAAGKTNFLESIYFLSNLKSFRAPDNLLVNTQEDYFKISGKIKDNELEVVVQTQPVIRRGFKINQQKIKKINWRTFKTVLFVPNDLNLFILGPAARRKYLNETLSQTNPAYAADVVSLEHILKQRAALLSDIAKRLASNDQLEFWNDQLAEISLRVSDARRRFFDYVNDKFNSVYEKLTGFNSEFKIEYKGLTANYTIESFLIKLEEYFEAEVRTGINLFGPHRDDFQVYKNQELNIYNSSRGELRSQVLTIKMLQAEYLTVGEDKPVILLDDVFSELDEIRRERLISSLTGHQIFITSTEEHHLPNLLANSIVLNVSDNNIEANF